MSKRVNYLQETVVSLLPLTYDANLFAALFSQAISREGYTVRGFRWSSLGFEKADVIILHWPDELLSVKGKMGLVRSVIKLATIRIAKLLWRAKIIWIAHNATPHDAVQSCAMITRSFLRSLDGVVYLSGYSQQLIRNLYPEVRTCKSLVTVHGHYRGAACIQETPWARSRDNIRLLHFGRIRPYKNIDALVEAVRSIAGLDLAIVGMVDDRTLRAAIEASVHQAPHVTLDFRETAISDAELATIVDSADAVVLPYRNILNSGSALFSLSRNRPVLAPNMGSLPELRESVGDEWVYLYEGEVDRQVLRDFRNWLITTKRGGVAPLDAYEWSRVGRELHDFIETVSGRSAGAPCDLSI